MLRSCRTVALAILVAPWSCGERTGKQIVVHRDSVPQAARTPVAAHADSDLLPAPSLHQAARTPVAADADSDLFPEPPLSPDTGPRHVVHGVCPFECCQYGRWTLESRATLRAAPAQDSDSIGLLEAGSAVRADSGVVVMHPIGLELVTRVGSDAAQGDSSRVAVGDTVEVLDYEGEGSFRTRWRGIEFSGGAGPPGTSVEFRTVRQPVGSWWVYMTDATSGRHGWALVSQRQGWNQLVKVVESVGSDACGD